MDTTGEELLKLELEQIIDIDLPLISILSNLSSFLHHKYIEKYNLNWTGFYISNSTNTMLYLGPFQGFVACTKIIKGRGVVGDCMLSGNVIIVDDVDTYDGHIRCDSRSRSEVVGGVVVDGKVVCVLDMDSSILSGFDDSVKGVVTLVCGMLSNVWDKLELNK